MTAAANNVYGRWYAVLANPAARPTVQGYPAEFEQRLVRADFRQIATDRDRILREWMSRFDGKSAPRN